MIKEYKLKDGTIRYMYSGYYGTDPITGKKIITKKRGFKTHKQAELAEARFKVSIADGIAPLNAKRMKFKELAELWLELYKSTVKATTYLIQKGVVYNHVIPYFGDMYVDKIDIATCQKYVNQQADKLVKYHNSCNLAYRILQYAIPLKLIKENPARDIIRPKAKKSEYKAQWWSKEELLIFLDCLHEADIDYTAKAMLHLICETGMRKGETMALYWEDIDFQQGTVNIYKTAGETEEGYDVQDGEEAKTRAGNRLIEIDSKTLQILKTQQIEQKKLLFMHGLKPNKGSEQLVFCNEKNQPLYGEYPNHYMDKVVTANALRRIKVHELRHTHCSILFEAGYEVKEVQDRIGHEDYKTTLDIYTHVSEKKKATSFNKYREFMSGNLKG
ncbi:site-specific integrase [Aerococcaceae bacterium DSM 111176]|nr:site-specific integrase [Aerococcaceae bacterium DSM 111176]